MYSFPNLKPVYCFMSSSNCCFLTCIQISQEGGKFSSVAQPCLTLSDPMDCSTPGFPVHHQFPELVQAHVHQVSDIIQPPILCRPLLLLASIFLSIRIFSSESVLHIRCPKYWGFSFTLVFECWVLSQLFHSPLSLSSRGSSVPLLFLP